MKSIVVISDESNLDKSTSIKFGISLSKSYAEFIFELQTIFTLFIFEVSLIGISNCLQLPASLTFSSPPLI